MSSAHETVLCYGFQIKPNEGEDELTFENFLARLRGFQKPDEEFNPEKFKSDPTYQEVWRDYWSEKGAVVQGHEITLVRYGSKEHPEYILAAKASVFKVSSRELIAMDHPLVILSICREDIRDFCRNAQIQCFEPELFVCSFEG